MQKRCRRLLLHTEISCFVNIGDQRLTAALLDISANEMDAIEGSEVEFPLVRWNHLQGPAEMAVASDSICWDMLHSCGCRIHVCIRGLVRESCSRTWKRGGNGREYRNKPFQ